MGNETSIGKPRHDWNKLNEATDEGDELHVAFENRHVVPCVKLAVHEPSQWHNGDFNEIISSEEGEDGHEVNQVAPAWSQRGGPLTHHSSNPKIRNLSETNFVSPPSPRRDSPIRSEWFTMKFDWSREVAKALKL